MTTLGSWRAYVYIHTHKLNLHRWLHKQPKFILTINYRFIIDQYTRKRWTVVLQTVFFFQWAQYCPQLMQWRQSWCFWQLVFGSKVHSGMHNDYTFIGALIDEFLTIIYYTDENQFSIRNCVEKALCAIGCIGVVILALAWTFYVVNRCKYPCIHTQIYKRLFVTCMCMEGHYTYM